MLSIKKYNTHAKYESLQNHITNYHSSSYTPDYKELWPSLLYILQCLNINSKCTALQQKIRKNCKLRVMTWNEKTISFKTGRLKKCIWLSKKNLKIYPQWPNTYI